MSASVDSISPATANSDRPAAVPYAAGLRAVEQDLQAGVRHLALALAGAEQLTRDFPTQFGGWQVQAQLLAQKGEPLRAITLLEDCCTRFAALPGPWLELARVHTSVGNAEAAAQALDAAFARGAPFVACNAVEHQTRMPRHLSDAGITALAREAGQREQPLRELLRDDRRAEVQVAAGEPGAPAVIVFTGMADRVSVPLETIDRMFAARGLSAIYCRDFSRRMYVHGIPSLAPDAAGTAVALRSLLDTLGATKVITLGNSTGGHGAIHYGLRLQADAVLSYAGPTNATAGFLAPFDERSGILARRLNRDPVAGELDLRPMVDRAEARVQVHLIHGAGMHEDRIHAEYLAGLPGVHLHGDPKCADHGVLSHHMADGQFVALLERVVAGND